MARYPFCNLGALTKAELPLDLASLFDRIVQKKRGGYCFEHNGLVFDVLDGLGFAPKLYLARVVYNMDTHRISVVNINNNDYLVDVGFGAQGPAIAVPLNGEVVDDAGRQFRVEKRNDSDYHLQILKDGAFFSLYRFELCNYGQADCELGHFYSHKHPNAAFVNRLVAARIIAQQVHSLVDLDYRLTTDTHG